MFGQRLPLAQQLEQQLGRRIELIPEHELNQHMREHVLRRMIADGVKVQTIVTSPPYWGLRSYDEGAVTINPNLDAEQRAWVEAELVRRGIHARR